MKKSDDLIIAIVNLNEANALSIVQARLDTGETALNILNDTRTALRTVGEYFESGDYYIPELIYSGEIMKGINNLVKPYIVQDIKSEHAGKVVLGTVEGDIHDIGKDLVAFMLQINGFEVFDLGVDVSAGRFVTRVQETGAKIVGLSAFLTGCIESLKSTVLAIREDSQCEGVKIMIGGNFISDFVCNAVGADGWGRDATAAVRLARMWTGHEG